MIYFIIFIVYFLRLKNKGSVTSIISLLIAFSGLCAYLIDKDIDYTNIEDYIYTIYTSGILLLSISAIKNIDRINLTELSKIKFNRDFINVLHVLGFFALIFSIYILATSINAFSAAQGTVEDYKNEGQADALIKAKLGPLVVSFVRLVSPLSYLMLPLHFIYVLKKKYLTSILFLFYATVLPLVGLFALSRSFLTQFIIVYFLFFILFRRQFSKKIKKTYYIVASLLLLIVGGVNYAIAQERFAESYYYDYRISKNSLIQDKSTYSLLDYFSQWIYNNNETLKYYTIDKNLSGQGSFPLLRRFGFVDSKDFFDQRSKSLDKYSTTFNGLVSAFVYDFGFIISLVIFVFTWKLIRNKFSRLNRIKVTDIMLLSLYFAFIGLFFVGNILYYEIFSIAIIYLILITKTKVLNR